MSLTHPTSPDVVRAAHAVAGAGGAAGAAGAHPAGPAGTRPRSRIEAPQAAPGPRIATLARGFVTLFLEVESGRRPRAQLAPLMTPMLYARLSEVWVRGGAPGSVLSVQVAASGAAGADVVALVRRGARCGAVALRLVRSPRGWLVDEVALPEHGPLPLPAYPVPAEEREEDDLALIPGVELTPSAVGGDWLRAPAHG